jgi:hypothetical protein
VPRAKKTGRFEKTLLGVPMKHAVHIAVGLIVVAMALPAPALADDRILGRWDSQSRSKGGIGSMLHFRGDGTVDVTVGAMLDFKYRTAGNRLYLALGTETFGPIEYSIKGNTLIRKDPKAGTASEASRVAGSAPPVPTIVGTWRSSHPTGADLVEEFLPDGVLLYRVPFRTDRGRFQADGSTLSMQIPRRPRTYIATYRVEGNVMVVTYRHDGKEERYMRVERAPIIVTTKFSHE